LVEAPWLGGLSETARAALGAISVAARLRDLRGGAYRGLWVVGEEWFGTRAGFGGYLGFFTAQYLPVPEREVVLRIGEGREGIYGWGGLLVYNVQIWSCL